MVASTTLRPGVALGVYPQREDLRDNWLERTAATVTGFVRQHARGRQARYGHFLRLVERESQGLEDLRNSEIRALVPELSRRLYSEGLEEALVARTFGVIRELAWRCDG